MRDYVQRNFVSKGMCADWAIHDSENDKGERNLHVHILLTLRPLEQDGKWGAKSRKVFDLDGNGERIPLIDKKTGQQKVDRQNRKQWKCHTENSTDWNSRENAKMWRKELADTINATNEKLGIGLHWEHRSFKEQGIDREPTIHIGATANALERMGIQTERGNVNREIINRNMMLEKAEEQLEIARREFKEAAERISKAKSAEIKAINEKNNAVNEVVEMIERVRARMGRLALPIVSAKYLAKIPNRGNVQDIRNALDFLQRNSITTYAQLERFRIIEGKEFDARETVFLSKWRRLEQLKALAEAYAEYEPYKKIHDESKSLSGLKKWKFEREHEKDLVQYDMTRAGLKKLLPEGGKITPKAWKVEQEQLGQEMPELRNERARTCHDLAFAEVISYNKANLERIEQNESRQQNRQQSRTKRREEEL